MNGLRERLREVGLDEKRYWWYLDLHCDGSGPPLRFSAWIGTDDDVSDRPQEHPRRDSLPTHTRQRGFLIFALR